VVIGGLTASTLITLVFVPTVYTLFEEGLASLRRGVHTPDVESRGSSTPVTEA
jgi:hypothetical protein